jgi:hypothetical protein
MSVIISAIIRHVIGIYGASVAAGGTADIGALFVQLVDGLASGDKHTFLGAVVALAAVAWSLYDKKTRQKKEIAR